MACSIARGPVRLQQSNGGVRVGEGVSGEGLGQVGPAGHWKNLASPLTEIRKLLEQCHENGRLTTEHISKGLGPKPGPIESPPLRSILALENCQPSKAGPSRQCICSTSSSHSVTHPPLASAHTSGHFFYNISPPSPVCQLLPHSQDQTHTL